MITIIKNGQVLSPENLGKIDLLFVGKTIVNIADTIEPGIGMGSVKIIDAAGRYVIPGLIDQHNHLLGGGGEGGPSTRTPEVFLSHLTSVGITTVIGVLGTDGVTRSVEALLAKARGLEEEGISSWIYTGSYDLPSPTITGSVRSDVALIDKVVGCKVAIADHRSSQPSLHELARMAAESRVGGLLGGKAGVLHFHVGDTKQKLDILFSLVAETSIPIDHFTPTHLNKNKELLMEGVKFAQMGGKIDITSGSPPIAPTRLQPPEAIKLCLAEGVSLDRITMSSDGNGSMPVFNEKRELVGLTAASPVSLFNAVCNIVKAGILPLEDAIRPVTINPATSLKLPNKGRLALGFDADILILDQELKIKYVFAKGRCMLDGDAVVTGVFEKR